ncbi:MAPEG family protein [Candidatus Synechococcus calcipolaris G9]|uniref:MAPEG family protein n=1 Tax=Candidatus Synechococcus calcipolaris G9 TaxID=1497997 RepID=A0ABT6F3J8_9SYNE|nr:MAPEG family protein [Candidatus Synechococcus calcipolaris]MDG2992353.1 MAPEG family protein [Candidatus Synechococcus calcipolaris G9]
MLITPGYAALFALFLIGLSGRVIILRGKSSVALGDGGQIGLKRAIRVHANFVEYVPFTLFIIYLLEVQTGSSLWIHGLCGGLFLGRCLHAFGLSQTKENLIYRVTGMVVTFAVLAGAAIAILVSYRS